MKFILKLKHWHFIFTLLLISCTASTLKEEKALHSIEDLQTEVVNHEVSKLRETVFSFYGTVLTFNDIIFEDEEVSWKGLNYFYKGDLLFIAETSWKNQEIITRVTVKSHSLKTKAGLGVGQNFEAIQPHVIFESSKDFPDGYIAFTDSSDTRITYIMDTEQYPGLWKEVWAIDKIPGTLQVQDVVILQ